MDKIEKRDVIITGKAKAVYHTNQSDLVWVENLNQATAFNGKKKEHIAQKAVYTNRISALLFQYLTQQGVTNHFVQVISERESLVKKLTMAKVEVVTRNFAAGSFVKKYGIQAGQPLTPPVQEFYYKNDALDDPMLNTSQIVALNLATQSDVQTFQTQALAVNQHFQALFLQIGIQLVDFKVEFGYDDAGNILLGDELSPDNMRLIDVQTHESLDKDVFRQGTGDLTTVYAIVLERLQQVLGE